VSEACRRPPRVTLPEGVSCLTGEVAGARYAILALVAWQYAAPGAIASAVIRTRSMGARPLDVTD